MNMILRDARHDDSSRWNNDPAHFASEDRLPTLPIRNMVTFPQMKVPLMVSPASSAVIDEAMQPHRQVGVPTVKNPAVADPAPDGLYELGTMAGVVHALQGEKGDLAGLLKGLHRFQAAVGAVILDRAVGGLNDRPKG